jgi:hypothetical protein
LYHAALRTVVRRVVEQHSSPGWRDLSGEWLPAGWSGIAGARFTHIFDAPEEVSQLAPRLETELHLTGGLKFTEQCWMTAAPPSVEIWTASPRSIQVLVNDRVIHEGEAPATFELSAANLPDGQYELFVLGRLRRFELRSSAPAEAKSEPTPIGWELEPGGRAITCSQARRLASESEGLFGAHFSTGAQVAAVNQRVLVHESGAEEAAWLGREPGQVAFVTQRQLQGQQSGFQHTVVRPGFKVAWLALTQGGRVRVIPFRHPPMEVELPDTISGRQMGAVETWRDRILSSSLVSGFCSDSCRHVCSQSFDDYTTAAELFDD